MTEYILNMQSDGVGAFASVTISITESNNKENQVFLLNTAFDWSKESYGKKAWFPKYDNFLVAGTINGITLALNDLNLSYKQVLIKRVYYHMVDSTEEGFALAGYQAVYKEILGYPKYKRNTLEILHEMKKRLILQGGIGMPIISFIKNYSEDDYLKIIFAWNGKFSDDFNDSNYYFRLEVLKEFEVNPSAFPIELVAALYEAETEYAEKAWGVNMAVSPLASELLERGRTNYLEEYYRGSTRGFDAGIASRRLSVSKECLKELITYCENEGGGNKFPSQKESQYLLDLFMAYLHDIEEDDVFVEDTENNPVSANPFIKGKWLVSFVITFLAIVFMIISL